jgi:hypothetical protein
MTAALRLGGRHSGRHGCLRDPLRPRHRVLHWIQLQHALPRRPVDPRAPLRHRHVSAPAAAGLVAASTCERARRSRTRCRIVTRARPPQQDSLPFAGMRWLACVYIPSSLEHNYSICIKSPGSPDDGAKILEGEVDVRTFSAIRFCRMMHYFSKKTPNVCEGDPSVQGLIEYDLYSSFPILIQTSRSSWLIFSELYYV